MNICSPLWLIPMLYNDFPTMYGCIWLYCIWWWWWCVCVFVCVCVCSPAVENSPQSKHNLVVDTQENIPIYPGTLQPATLLFAKGWRKCIISSLKKYNCYWPSVLQDWPPVLQDWPPVLQDWPSVLQDWPPVQDWPSVLQDWPFVLQNWPSVHTIGLAIWNQKGELFTSRQVDSVEAS